MKFNPAKAKRTLDRLFSQLVLTKANRTCARCGKIGKTDTAHIIPREILLTRWNPENAIALCPRDHKFGNNSCHKNPLAFVKWYQAHYSNSEELLKLSELKYEFTEKEYLRIKQSLEYHLAEFGIKSKETK